MGIAWLPRCDGKAQFQKPIGCFEGVDPRQPHLLYQTVLQRFKQALDASLRADATITSLSESDINH
jgi:hypothetical protein